MKRARKMFNAVRDENLAKLLAAARIVVMKDGNVNKCECTDCEQCAMSERKCEIEDLESYYMEEVEG